MEPSSPQGNNALLYNGGFMGQIISDIIKGFIFLAFSSEIYGMSQDLVSKAVAAHKTGLMSYYYLVLVVFYEF